MQPRIPPQSFSWRIKCSPAILTANHSLKISAEQMAAIPGRFEPKFAFMQGPKLQELAIVGKGEDQLARSGAVLPSIRTTLHWLRSCVQLSPPVKVRVGL